MWWGPVWLLRDSAFANVVQGAIFLLALGAALIFAALNLPKWWAFGALILALFAWLIIGVIGSGIGC